MECTQREIGGQITKFLIPFKISDLNTNDKMYEAFRKITDMYAANIMKGVLSVGAINKAVYEAIDFYKDPPKDHKAPVEVIIASEKGYQYNDTLNGRFYVTGKVQKN
jgi:hypothetical protein